MAMNVSDYGKNPTQVSREELEKKKRKKRYSDETYKRRLNQQGRNGSY